MSAATFASAIFGTWDETGADGALVVDRATSVVTCANPRFAELLGRDADDLAGCPLAELLPQETSSVELLTSFGPRDHVAFRHAAGGVVYLTLTIAPVSQPGHGPLVACLCRDTTGTRRRAHERRLARHSQEYPAQGDLARLAALPSASSLGPALPLGALPLLPPREYTRDHAPVRPQEPSEDHS